MKRGISHATSAIRIVVVGDISVSEEGIVAIRAATNDTVFAGARTVSTMQPN